MKQPGESILWFSRFQNYLKQGIKRSLRVTYIEEKRLECPPGKEGEFEGWAARCKGAPEGWSDKCREFNWHERAAAFDQHERAKRAEDQKHELDEMNRRHTLT